MSTEADRLLDQTLRLAPKERARLAARLLGSLEGSGEDRDWQVAWEAELMRRDHELEMGEVQPLSIDEALQVVLAPGDEPER